MKRYPLLAGVFLASLLAIPSATNAGTFHFRAKVLLANSTPATNVNVAIHEMGFPDDPARNNYFFGHPNTEGIVEGDIRAVRQVAVLNTRNVFGREVPDPLGGTHLEDDRLDHPSFVIIVSDDGGHVHLTPPFPYDVVGQIMVALPPQFGPLVEIQVPAPTGTLHAGPIAVTAPGPVAVFLPGPFVLSPTVDPAPRRARRDLNSLTDPERRELIRLMKIYLTDDVVAHHGMLHGMITVDVFTMHRPLIQDLEAFLSRNGGQQFVPFPAWDPGNAIPSRFHEVRQPNQPFLPHRKELLPRTSIPRFAVLPEWKLPIVCRYKTLEDLALDVAPIYKPHPEEAEPGMPFVFGGWHKKVHDGVGGTLQNLKIAAAAYIFWGFHARMDDIWSDWQSCATH